MTVTGCIINLPASVAPIVFIVLAGGNRNEHSTNIETASVDFIASIEIYIAYCDNFQDDNHDDFLSITKP